MTIEALLMEYERKQGWKTLMPNAKLVQDWWPKPTIKFVPQKYWGDKHQNVNSRCIHKYVCFSFSSIGFYSSEKNVEGLPSNKCLAYGETPEQAYNSWCEIFNAWNIKEGWVK